MKRLIVFGVLAILMLAASIVAYTCPYTGDTSPAEYSTVTIMPPEKYVGKKFTVSIIDVYQIQKKQEPANDRLILIYLIENNKTVSDYSIYTDSEGKATFTPEDSGSYAVATSGRYIYFNVLAKCGDDRCTSGENRINCPEDCSKCGDWVCDAGETKENCPHDCIVCGDDVCDPGEDRASCPQDCAHCGDGVCDVNENKNNCPQDCVICGDGVCDCQEITGLHNTTCPQDCVKCGDGVCDSPYENFSSCPHDCAVCGDRICSPGENVTCQQDCTVCGDNVCDTKHGENKTSCPQDCVKCGDDMCDPQEITSLHQTTCSQDCTVCGDGICDYGESKTCSNDCQSNVEGILMGYFVIPIGIALLIILFEITRHYWGSRRKVLAAEKAAARKAKLVKMSPGAVIPYLLIFSVSLAAMSILLAVLGLDYEKDLAILDVGSFLLNNGVILSLIVIALGVGIGILSRATYYMERNQAIALSLGFGFLGMIPGMVIFLSLEYLVLLVGLVFGILVATVTVKKEETEFVSKKPFRIGSEAADKMLTVAVLFFCLLVFLELSTSQDTADKFTKAIAGSDTTREVIVNNVKAQSTETDIKDKFVTPFFDTYFGSISGKVVFAIAATFVLLAIVKVFIILIKIMSGFFSWMLDKSGLV